MQKISRKMVAALVVVVCAAPMIASAETTATVGLSADIQAQVQTLLSQIKSLQDQIKTLVGSSTPRMGEWMQGGGMNPGQMAKLACITIKRNLRQGDSGEDVKKIQEMLAQDPETGFNASATGFFGPMTMRAMAKFQMKMGIASSTDGSIGPMTRGFFERRCGQGLDGQPGQGMQGKMPGSDLMMGGIVRGTISANNTSSITVQTDGASVTVNVSASTEIKLFSGTSSPPTTGTAADLMVGKKVMVGGQKQSDGSINAVHIAVGEILPMIKIEGMPKGDYPMPPFGQGQGSPGKPMMPHGSIVPDMFKDLPKPPLEW